VSSCVVEEREGEWIHRHGSVPWLLIMARPYPGEFQPAVRSVTMACSGGLMLWSRWKSSPAFEVATTRSSPWSGH
jgi:hypothetical protein